MIAQDYKVGPMKDIRYVGFSSDSQYFVVVSMPDESHLLVRAWDTQRGSLCGNLRVRLQVGHFLVGLFYGSTDQYSAGICSII